MIIRVDPGQHQLDQVWTLSLYEFMIVVCVLLTRPQGCTILLRSQPQKYRLVFSQASTKGSLTQVTRVLRWSKRMASHYQIALPHWYPFGLPLRYLYQYLVSKTCLRILSLVLQTYSPVPTLIFYLAPPIFLANCSIKQKNRVLRQGAAKTKLQGSSARDLSPRQGRCSLYQNKTCSVHSLTLKQSRDTSSLQPVKRNLYWN